MWSILSTIHVHAHAHVHHWETCRLISCFCGHNNMAYIHCEYAQKILVSPVDDPGHRCDVTNNGTSLNESIPQTCDDEGVCQYDSCLMYTWALQVQSWKYCFWTNCFWTWWGCTYQSCTCTLRCDISRFAMYANAMFLCWLQRSSDTERDSAVWQRILVRPRRRIRVDHRHWCQHLSIEYHLSCIQRYALAAIN